MSRACLITLLAFAAISCAAASRILEDDAAAMGRELLQTKADRFICSNWCEQNKCIRVGTTGLVKCLKCQGTMQPILSGANAGQCGCPAGTYFDSSVPTCKVCEVGSYCYKQLTWINNTADGTTIGKTGCGLGLTTRARRSTSIWDCVNAGGYKLTNTGTGPTAQACTLNTYAIAKSKQTACTPCPAGMKVPVVDLRDKPTSCKVPPGYFMKSPGQIAPCDQGSYQPEVLDGSQAQVGACIACPEGVTTADKASDALGDCNLLKPGYVATSLGAGGNIATAVLCPQGYWCPGSGASAVTAYVTISELTQAAVTGGTFIATVAPFPAQKTTDEAFIKQCTNNAWTKTVGATAVDQCMVPPGFELYGGTVTACGDSNNKYRSDWISLAAAATKLCLACGTGIKAEKIEPITLYSLNTTGDANTDYTPLSALVKASSKSCYIEQGQGMYYVASGSEMVYKARDCGAGTSPVANSYGVADKVFGLAQTPCKLCPAGTKADPNLAATDVYKNATSGFYDPLACVTKPGYGWDGRVATLCPKGWYNEGNNYKACTQCAYGLTTADPIDEGTETDNVNDCKIAPGFGSYTGKLQLCPAGSYNDVIQPLGTECKLCNSTSTNSWTEEEGSDAAGDCAVCEAGYGGVSAAACIACGAAGTYGPPGRDTTQCEICPKSLVGFQFYYNNTAKPYISDAVAKTAAQDASDCVAAMAQIEDGLWYLAAEDSGANTNDAVATSTAANVGACATTCLTTPGCALATFDYSIADGVNACSILTITNDDAVPAITAFKAVPSSDVSQSRKLQAAKPKAVSTGMYTQYKYAGAALTTPTTNKQTLKSVSSGNKAACFDFCDELDSCAAVVFDGTTGCMLIEGATDPAITANAAKRSLTRAVPSKFVV